MKIVTKTKLSGTQQDEHRSVFVERLTIDDKESLLISVNDGGDGAAFFFDDEHQLKSFAKQLTELADTLV